jgi:Tfp pilus assembly protein PilF
MPNDLRRALALLEQGDWRGAHSIVQADEDSRHACWAHAIVHVMEGDLANARYWYRRAGRAFSADAGAEIRALSESLKL